MLKVALLIRGAFAATKYPATSGKEKFSPVCLALKHKMCKIPDKLCPLKISRIHGFLLAKFASESTY